MAASAVVADVSAYPEDVRDLLLQPLDVLNARAREVRPQALIAIVRICPRSGCVDEILDRAITFEETAQERRQVGIRHIDSPEDQAFFAA